MQSENFVTLTILSCEALPGRSDCLHSSKEAERCEMCAEYLSVLDSVPF